VKLPSEDVMEANAMEDDLIEQVEELKEALIAVVTGQHSEYPQSKYRVLRKVLSQHPEAQAALPEWLRRGSTIAEVNTAIRGAAGQESGMWQRRRAIVIKDLNKIIDVLEGDDAVSAATLEKGERIGGGGYGEVFKVTHRLIDDLEFAMKVLNPTFASDADHATERFFQEARILFRLRHPNIVQVYDVGLIGRRPFIRMELIEGESLAAVIRRKGSLKVKEARSTMRQLASALAYAHEAGVVHRDIKPSNIMISGERVVLLDFGLGAFLEDELVSRITRTGEAPAGGIYTSPELLSNPHDLDPRHDIYSLGAVCYEAIVGSAPAGSRIERRLEERLSPAESELILSCLGPLSERPSAKELLELLDGSRVRG